MTDASGAFPDEIIEDYSSLIWTERYDTHGDFQLKTPKIKETMDLLSIGGEFNEFCMFGHKDSAEIMLFDTWEIDTNEDGVEELTITGRTMTSMLEQRAVEGLRGVSWKQQQAYTSLEFAGGMIWDAFGMGFNQIPIDLDPVISQIFQVPQAANMYYVLTSTLHRSIAAAQDWYVEPGETWKKVTDAISFDRLGIRMIRPGFDIPGTNNMIYDGSGGSVSYLGGGAYTNDDTAQINIYTGQDRPNTIFSWDVGDLETAKYLFSLKGWKNVCYVLADSTANDDIWVYMDGASDTTSTQQARRAMVIDGELNRTAPDGSVMDNTEYRTALEQKGLAVLRANRKQKILDSSISAKTEYKYKVDYDLGDTVTVMGDHGFVETMMVQEHIRTEDQEGDREFPTLVRSEI